MPKFEHKKGVRYIPVCELYTVKINVGI